MAVPPLVADVLHTCDHCLGCVDADVIVVMKNGDERNLSSDETTLGFSIARHIPVEDEGSESDEPRSVWLASTRITLARSNDPRTDPSTIILGLKPNEALPIDTERTKSLVSTEGKET